ncbi:MAG: endonuclease MutS2 [Lachnospiraceae bacterium]|nr:endonuclease MutS2 [Lachnospiraceae bacterium]
MNHRVLKLLEYTEIIERLTGHAGSERGRRICKKLTPMKDPQEIETALRETSDALGRLLKNGRLSFGGVKDLLPSLKHLSIGGNLGAGELLDIASTLECVQQVFSFFKDTETPEHLDSLDPYLSLLTPLPDLSGEIRRCIVSADEIADDASPALKDLRRKMRGMGDKIHNQMTSMLNNQDLRDHLQDSVITMRDGRYCLPVKASSKSLVPGMIHDQSGSGSTLFIEPMAVVNLNNELKALQLKEQEEIQIILATLTDRVRSHQEALEENYRTLTTLDFIFAKAAYALEYNGTVPLLNEEGRIRLRKARHPLLDPKKAVPIDLTLGEQYDQLIITGPNTGGKTVSLKTTGLLTLMGLAGMLIPAGDRSELSVFHTVYADIGDEQSIAQSLSTFSAHTTNIVSILKHVNDRSLVLFDELCAGTDPTEGAALATAILSDLHRRRIRTMATTHYSELKIYAMTTEGVENASCEFDVDTLSPTYRLMTGIPGKSNAFAISKKLGLPDALIEDAQGRMTTQAKDFEDLIADLEESRLTAEKEQEKIRQLREETEKAHQTAHEKKERMEDAKDRILREANEEAARVLQEAKDFADRTIRDFRKYHPDSDAIREMEQERSALREQIKATENRRSKKQQKADAPHPAPKSVSVGDRVRVRSLNLNGTVHTLPNAKGDLTVQMGILSSTVNIRDLELLPDAPDAYAKKSAGGTGKIKLSKSATVSAEVNLIGKTTSEAIAILDKYLDDALLAHIPSVRIVHGKGTGALRNAVWQHLKNLSYIGEYHLGEYGEGDAGVTIASFK